MSVVNKATNDADIDMVREHLPEFPLLGVMRYNEKVIRRTKAGVSPYDIDPAIRTEVEEIIAAFEKVA